MKVIEFEGDPMLQLEKFDDLDNYIFYLSQEAMDEIKSYSNEVKENLPDYFDNINSDFVLLAEGGIDEEGNEFPDTYIGINIVQNQDFNYKIAGIYAEDIQYISPKFGDEILLKKTSLVKKIGQ